MQKSGKILWGRKDTLAPVVSTLRGERPRRRRHSDAFDCNTASQLCIHHMLECKCLIRQS